MPASPFAAGALAALLLAGCAGNPLGESPATALTSSVVMTGRWILTTPNAPSCGMHFAGAPDGKEGAIEPEGGCPGNFFTSRHWTLAAGALTINDQNNLPLAQLNYADGGFKGKTTAGTPLTLSR